MVCYYVYTFTETGNLDMSYIIRKACEECTCTTWIKDYIDGEWCWSCGNCNNTNKIIERKPKNVYVATLKSDKWYEETKWWVQGKGWVTNPTGNDYRKMSIKRGLDKVKRSAKLWQEMGYTLNIEKMD